jgi:hypothetical protein
VLEERQTHGVSCGTVRNYVAVRRGEIRAMAGRGPVEAFVPQSHRPGVEAKVDFGDVTVRLAGQTVTCYLFSFRLSYSGKAVHGSSRPADKRRSSKPRARPQHPRRGDADR